MPLCRLAWMRFVEFGKAETAVVAFEALPATRPLADPGQRGNPGC